MSEFKTESTIPNVHQHLQKAALIFEYTHTSATSLMEAFADAREKRANPQGILTDKEQDILRAAVGMTCAGMDGALKQGIRDCLSHLLNKYISVREEFEKSTRKLITNEDDALNTGCGAKFPAQVLADDVSPRNRPTEEYIRHLTGGSLQSYEEVFRTIAALGIDQAKFKRHVPMLKQIFLLRNKIIHELDIDLDAPKRKRKVRSKVYLLASAEHVLKVTRIILQELNRQP